jgi:hypothetical protein
MAEARQFASGGLAVRVVLAGEDMGKDLNLHQIQNK